MLSSGAGLLPRALQSDGRAGARCRGVCPRPGTEREAPMKLYVAKGTDFEAVRNIVHETIEMVYSSFYPDDVVRFFLDHHVDEKIREDIDEGRVYLLDIDGVNVGTGTVNGNEIGRVFVLPAYQRRGYGTLIMHELEAVIGRTSRVVRLDSSLPGYGLYLKLGYHPVAYRMISMPSGQVLCYHVMEKPLVSPRHRLAADENAGEPCYNGKRFTPVSNTKNGEAAGETIFYYHQDGSTVWAEYSGGPVLRGFLVGTVHSGGDIDFAYEHISGESVIRTGRGHSTPELLSDGRVRLHEKWNLTSGDCSSGESTLDEIR